MRLLVFMVLGVLLLIWGRKLFWLFVGAVGFVVGINLATRFFQSESELTVLVMALIAGTLCAVVALFVQRIAVALAGFVVGGYVLFSVVNLIIDPLPLPVWVLYLIGGVIGVLLVGVLFDWALILLSSIAGADMLVEILPVPPAFQAIAGLVLVVVGVVIQHRAWRSGE